MPWYEPDPLIQTDPAKNKTPTGPESVEALAKPYPCKTAQKAANYRPTIEAKPMRRGCGGPFPTKPRDLRGDSTFATIPF
jgi:hypothetical protein